MPAAQKANLKILIRSAAIDKRVREVAGEITKDFKGERVHLIGVLKGACIFLSDLVREINLETSIDFIAVSSYGKGKESSGQVRVLKDLDSSIEGLNVILVEDILDTGLTLSYLLRVLQQRKPKSAARGGAARQAFAAAEAGARRLRRLYDPQRIRGGLRPRLRRAIPQSEGRLRPRLFPRNRTEAKHFTSPKDPQIWSSAVSLPRFCATVSKVAISTPVIISPYSVPRLCFRQRCPG